MLGRYLPHPFLTLTLTIVWVLLMNSFTAGNLVLGLILGLVIPVMTRAYWPDRAKLRNLPMIIEYCLVVVWDICVANAQVAYLILTRRGDELRSRFITVPLELRTPEAITVLAGTITMTPGTVSSDLSADGRALLVHCLDTNDPEATVATIKSRYEARLKEIFE
jgi:multicomponent K+:H+ antiporter subunit E